ncbi:hypothetical protein [Palleronia abyssalis]|uniref:Uncharacterized protein n=1 Tax=Palleronia abyssalis TaxID=1501240 RepID=A0A2R8BZK8_9RHOB|nr:hypothetical protein [Palleronia abyssalis]SPJ25526.1 hypothetical protein PAA8504_03377 [Palleronia abyssalis]
MEDPLDHGHQIVVTDTEKLYVAASGATSLLYARNGRATQSIAKPALLALAFHSELQSNYLAFGDSSA